MKKLLSLILALSIFSSIAISASALEKSNYDIELGNDIAFLTDEKRQEEWIKQAWERIDAKPAVGDWKTGSRATGAWSWRDGVICYTDSYSSFLNHGHAGIVGISPYDYGVVESNPSTGVAINYGDWVTRYGAGGEKRVVQTGVTETTVQQDHNAAAWAVQQVGKPYGDFYATSLNNRDKYYCSHLVYAAYKDTAGVNLDTSSWPGIIHPIELVDNPKLTKIFDTN